MLTKLQAVRSFFQVWPKILKSKTLIVNVAMLVIALATAALEVDIVTQNKEIAAFLSATLIPAANIILRFFTKTPVSKKKSLWG